MNNVTSKESSITILVTGSNGLLGQKIIQKLVAKNDPKIYIIGCGKGANRLPKSIHGFQYEELDITQEKQINEIFEKYKPTHLIHTAAQTNVDYCELNHDDCWKANVDAVSYLAAACEKYHTHLVHVSTDFIFDGLKGGLYSEDDKAAPLSFYGNSKWEAEKIVQKSKAHWAILRTILVYGVVSDMSRSNVVLWVKKSLEEGKKINVVFDQARTPTLAEDLADGCIAAALKNAEGIYNIGGKDYMNIYELACRVADFFKLDKTLINSVDSTTFTQPAKRPPKTGFAIEKAKQDLGYNPHSFEEGLAILAKQLG